MDREKEEKGRAEGGTGLADVYKILSEVAQERLLSLTFKLGRTPVEEITHALTLICLRRGREALDKLQTLDGNSTAKSVAEMVEMCGGTLKDFRVDGTHAHELTEDNLIDLARIFKLLAEERLCETFLRDVAYQRALARVNKRCTSVEEGLKYTRMDELKEEAKMVCGPQIEESCSPFGGYFPPLGELSTALQTPYSHNHSQREQNQPSPLQACPSHDSYPTHLEISVSHTEEFQGNTMSKILPPSMIPHQLLNTHKCVLQKPTGSLSQATQPRTNETQTIKEVNQVPNHSAPCSSLGSGPSIPAQIDQNTHPKLTQDQENMMMKEEEDVFFSFVILHSAEDMDLADKLKEKLESLGIGAGATFSQDFEIPGRNTLTCIEDAIDNSAFTILLLTRSFNTRLLQVETNSALMNSINNKHKYNTVIPLLPQENPMHRENMPKVLRTLVSLEENNNFEKRAKKAIAPARIESQRQVWEKEQMIKQQRRRNERLRLEKKLHMEWIRERQEAEELQQEQGNPQWSPGQFHTQQSSWMPPRPNIHIQNASCIMIGNDSKMTVSLNGDNDFM